MDDERKLVIPLLPLAVGEGKSRVIHLGKVYTYKETEYKGILENVDLSYFPEAVPVGDVIYYRMTLQARGVAFLEPLSGYVSVLIRIPYGQKQNFTDEELEEYFKNMEG